jgi:AcrR family transcriptional regulator
MTVDDLVDAAMGLIEREGFDKLSMRALAQELGLSSMLAYYYVENKETLLRLVLDRICGSIEVPTADDGPWPERVHGLLMNSYREVVRYGGLLSTVLEMETLPPSLLRLLQSMSEILAEAGFDPGQIERVTTIIFVYFSGALTWQEAVRSKLRSLDSGGSRGRRARRLDSAEEEFSRDLEVLLAGLAASPELMGPQARRSKRGVDA